MRWRRSGSARGGQLPRAARLAMALLATAPVADAARSATVATATSVAGVAATAPPSPAAPTPTTPIGLPGLDPQAPAARPAYAARLHEDTRHVLAGPDFHRQDRRHELVARDWLRRLLQRKPDPAPSAPWKLDGAAALLKVLLSTAALLALAWLAWRGWRWLAPYAAARRHAPGRGPLREAASEPLAETPLPAAVASAAHAAWRAGNATLALSLLYRGAVRDLGLRHGIALPDSATEGECLRLARRSGQAVADDAFAPVVRAWQAMAYARQAPADFEALLRLYRQHFEAAEEVSP